jgi:uroporphyrinogen-III synthase
VFLQLAEHCFAQNPSIAGNNGGGGLIAGGFDTKNRFHRVAPLSRRAPAWDRGKQRYADIIDRRLFDKSAILQRVLITRPEPGASQTAVRVAALGLEPVVAPVLTIEPSHIDAPKSVAATLLTSANAIAACPARLYELPAYAVGSATARRAMEAGFAQVRDAGADAAALADLVAASADPAAGTLFLPCALGQATALAATLRTRGFRVVRRVAYRAAPVAALTGPALAGLRDGSLDFALVFSSETARHFVSLIQAAGLSDSVRNIDAVSISNRAAVALSALPWRRIHVAEKPNQDSMLVLLQ